MQCAMWHSNLPLARLILSAKGDNTATAVFNHEHALFFAKSSKMVEWALDSCIGENPTVPFGGLNLVSAGAGTLLHCCALQGIISRRVARLLRHQLTEKYVGKHEI